MALDVFPPEVADKLREFTSADLVVGIPTYNNAATIRHVAHAVVAGLAESFAQTRSIIVLSDGGSQDETRLLFEETARDGPPTLLVPHPVPAVQTLGTRDRGILGYDNAFRAIFEIAGRVQAKACVVIDGNLRSATPEWVSLLAKPILGRSFDLVAPLYRRHKYDGSLTNSMVYPMNRALYGKRMRYQNGGGYGFSDKLVSSYLAKDVWGGQIALWGLDNWVITMAIAEGYEVCQAYLGPKDQDVKGPAVDLSLMLSQTVGSVFSLMEAYQPVWESRNGSSPVPTFGTPYDVGTEPVTVNVARMVKAFKQGLRDLLPLWEIILGEETIAQVLPFGILDVEEFRFPIEVWVQVIYDFALSYHETVVHREHLLRALTPLYLGRTASFIMETKDSDSEEVERMIERLCREYEAQKPSLTERWRSTE